MRVLDDNLTLDGVISCPFFKLFLLNVFKEILVSTLQAFNRMGLSLHFLLVVMTRFWVWFMAVVFCLLGLNYYFFIVRKR